MSELLTDAKCRNAKPADKPRRISDAGCRGLSLVVEPSGLRRWEFRYRFAGKRPSVSIGTYADGPGVYAPVLMGLEEARERASELRKQVREGHNPAADLRLARAAHPTLRDVAEEYMSRHLAAHGKATTIEVTRGLLDRHILPGLGNVEIRHLVSSVVRPWHAKLGGPPPRGAGHGPTANRALRVVSAIFEYARRESLVAEDAPNPTKLVKKFKESDRYDNTLTAEERFALLRELESAPLRAGEGQGRAGRVSQHHADAIRLMFETGARVSEILELRWDEIDFDRGVLVLPETKTGKSIRPLSPRAVGVLEEIKARPLAPDAKPSPYVCASSTGKPIDRRQIARVWSLMRKRIGVRETIALRDLRHTAITLAIEATGKEHVGSALAGHSNPRTTRRYNKSRAEAHRAELAEAEGLFAGKAPALRVVDGGGDV